MQQFHLILGQEHNKNRNSDLCTASELVNHISIYFLFLFQNIIVMTSSHQTMLMICSHPKFLHAWAFFFVNHLYIIFQELNAINFQNGETKTTQ